MADTRRLVWDIFAIDRASKTFDHIAARGEHMGGRIGRVGGIIGGALAGAATLGVAALAGAFAEGLKQAADYEKITAQTAAVLKSTGGIAHVSAGHVKELADSVEQYSAFSDEAVQQGENLLLTFKNIQNRAGKGNDIFDRATKSLFDMSQARGEPPSKAAIQLGKALNDPIKGITALRRVGVSFSADQQKVIKHLVETGHTAAAQKIILRELNSEFGGSAKAAGQTFSGSLTRLKNTLMDVLRDALTPLLPYLTRFTTFLADKLPGAVKTVSGWLSTLKARFTETGGAGSQLSVAFQKVVAWVRDQLIPALQHFVQVIGPPIKNTMKDLGQALKSLGPSFEVIGTILTAVVIPALGQLIRVIEAILGPTLKAAAWLIRKAIVPAFSALVQMILESVSIIINSAAKAFGWIPGIGPKLKHAADDFNRFKVGVNAALSGIKDHTVSLNVVAKINGSTRMTNQQKAKTLDRLGFAGGTSSAPAGMAWVGEEGPELMRFRGGEQVYTAKQSARMAGGVGGGHVSLNVYYMGSASSPGERAKFGRFVEEALQNLRRPVQIKTA